MLAGKILLIATYNHYTFVKRFSSISPTAYHLLQISAFFMSVLAFAVAFWSQRPVNCLGLVRRLTILRPMRMAKLYPWRTTCPYVSISDRCKDSILQPVDELLYLSM
jgi:hypothetical protein